MAAVQPARNIRLRHSAVTRLLGQPISTEIIDCILRKLGCDVRQTDELNFDVNPPSYRTDLNAEHDLIEEIARVYGYENLPSSDQAPVYYITTDTKQDTLRAKTHKALQSCGFNEAVTYSMVNPAHQIFVLPVDEQRIVRLINPINDDLSVMRWTLLPNLLNAVRTNLFQKNHDVRLYEIGKTFLKPAGGTKDENGLPDEDLILAGCAAGNRHPVRWDSKPDEFDFHDLKHAVQTVLSQFMIDGVLMVPSQDNRNYTDLALDILLKGEGGNQKIGQFGKIKKSVLKYFDVDTDVWAFEIRLKPLFTAAAARPAYQMISRFPSIRRDLAVTVNRGIPAGQLMEAIQSAGGRLLRETDVFDVYTGDQIAKDKKSLAFSLRFQSPERTLVEDDVDRLMKNILQQLEKKFAAQIR